MTTERDDLDGLLTEMLAETGGPLTTAERRRADRATNGASKARRARRAPDVAPVPSSRAGRQSK